MTERSIMLEQLRYVARYSVPASLLDQLTLEQVEERVLGGLVYQLRASIFCQRLDEEVVRYPADWWQAFKQRFFPFWALRRWPVRETVKVMRLYAWYPDKQIPAERSQFVLRIADGEPPARWGPAGLTPHD